MGITSIKCGLNDIMKNEYKRTDDDDKQKPVGVTTFKYNLKFPIIFVPEGKFNEIKPKIASTTP